MGVADLATGEPMRTDFNYRLGSQTKMYISTIVLALVDRGYVALDDPVSRFVPTVPNGDNITVRMLMSNTSGLFSYSDDKSFGEALETDRYRHFTPDELIGFAFGHEPLFPPGQEWAYSNTNFVLLGMIAKAITGLEMPDIMRTMIAEPLGLENTVFVEDTSLPGDHPQGYLYVEGAREDWTDHNVSWAWTAGAMVGNVADSHKWVRAVVNGDLLSEQTQLERMTYWKDVEKTENGTILLKGKYGLGIFELNGFIGHNGALPGFVSGSFYNKETDTAIILMYNIQPEDSFAINNTLGRVAEIVR
jgi:D-alanyl-D-alanine carboxypeptidase